MNEKHPLGFRKFILASIFGYRLRLHIWPNGEAHDGCHNHRWWFISIPLWGCFIDTRYHALPDNNPIEAPLLAIDVADTDGRDSGRTYKLTGKSRLIPRARYMRRPLIPYICRIGDIHSYVPASKSFHASLVLVSPLKASTSRIWRTEDKLDVPLEDD